MQAATLPLKSGWQWTYEGFGLFRRQPLAMFFWSLAVGLLITISSLIPLIGQVVLIALTPLLMFLTLCACRNIATGKVMMPGMWLAPLRDAEARKRLLLLGVAYLVCLLTGGFVATLPFTNSLMQAVNPDGTINELMLGTALRGPLLVFGALYLLISALFWHAPALIGWHRIKFAQALFFSMVACWRNKWPFLLYGVSWAVVFIALQAVGRFLVDVGLAPDMAQLALTPVDVVAAAVLNCSFYPLYVSVFGANYPVR